MSDELVIICNPTDGYAAQVPGCTRDHCMICAAEVWVAPSSRLIAPAGPFLCSDCAPGVMATDASPLIMPPTPEQLAEVRRRFRG